MSTSATLLCRYSPGQHDNTNLIVDGLILPDREPLISLRSAGVEEPTEIELQWPPEMLRLLGRFFENSYARPGSLTEWNCHTFGAMVTGQIARLNNRGGLQNAIIGERVAPSSVANASLYGVVSGERIVHSLVSTQIPGFSLSTTPMGVLRYMDITSQEDGYSGELHTYRLIAPETHYGRGLLSWEVADAALASGPAALQPQVAV